MYKNLQDALRKKGITSKDFAEFLGVNEKSVYNKLNEETPFTYPEFRKTCKFLFPEYNPDYLFTSDRPA